MAKKGRSIARSSVERTTAARRIGKIATFIASTCSTTLDKSTCPGGSFFRWPHWQSKRCQRGALHSQYARLQNRNRDTDGLTSNIHRAISPVTNNRFITLLRFLRMFFQFFYFLFFSQYREAKKNISRGSQRVRKATGRIT